MPIDVVYVPKSKRREKHRQLGVSFRLLTLRFSRVARLRRITSNSRNKKSEFFVMLIVAAVAMWNMGVAFLVGAILDNALRKEWLRI